MKKNLLTVAVYFFFLGNGIAATPVLTIQKTAKACTPDGIIHTDGTEPWTTTWVQMTAKKTSNTVDEISARFQLAYNDDYLWIACQQIGNSTIDTDHSSIPNSWERDCFDIYLSIDTTSWSHHGWYGEANNQFRFQRAAIYPWAFDDSHHIGLNSADFAIGQYDAGDGSFTQEWQIPWSGLTAPMVDSGKFDGEYFKLELGAADNTTGHTGGRNDLVFWRNNSDNEYQDSRTHSLIMLDPPVGVALIDSINFISPVDSDVWMAGTNQTIDIYYRLISGNYNYSIYYRKVGGSNVFLKNLTKGGNIPIYWTIDFAESGKYNIVLYDSYKTTYYYSDTFTITPSPPLLNLTSPLSGSSLNSESNCIVKWLAYKSGNINIEISENSGVSWDTLAKNVVSNNSSSNSYLVKMPIFTSDITNGILKISNDSNTLYSQADNLHFNMNNPKTPALVLYKAIVPCTPDGIIKTDGSEPWTSSWISMTAKKTSSTTNDMSARFQLAYDDDYLWIACQQTGNATIDTNPATIPNSWERDDFEVFVAMDTNSWQGSYGEADNQFRMQRAAEYPWGFDDAHSIGHNNSDFTIAQVDPDNGSFTQEWQIPWSGLTAPMIDSGNFDNRYFKFEIMASDNTTGSVSGRTEQIFWRNSSDNEYQDTRTFSLVKMVPDVGSPIIDYYNFISPLKSTIWTAGTSQFVNIYYTLVSGSYNYSIYYRKVGGSNVFLNTLNFGGNSSTIWNINKSEEGLYNIVLYDHNSSIYYYSDTFTISKSNVVINTLHMESFKVTPNPFNNKLTITYELTSPSKLEIVVYDILGKYVKTVYSGVLSKGKQFHTVDVSELNNGVYIIQLKTSTGILNQMVIKN